MHFKSITAILISDEFVVASVFARALAPLLLLPPLPIGRLASR